MRPSRSRTDVITRSSITTSSEAQGINRPSVTAKEARERVVCIDTQIYDTYRDRAHFPPFGSSSWHAPARNEVCSMEKRNVMSARGGVVWNRSGSPPKPTKARFLRRQIATMLAPMPAAMQLVRGPRVRCHCQRLICFGATSLRKSARRCPERSLGQCLPRPASTRRPPDAKTGKRKRSNEFPGSNRSVFRTSPANGIANPIQPMIRLSAMALRYPQHGGRGRSLRKPQSPQCSTRACAPPTSCPDGCSANHDHPPMANGKSSPPTPADTIRSEGPILQPGPALCPAGFLYPLRP